MRALGPHDGGARAVGSLRAMRTLLPALLLGLTAPAASVRAQSGSDAGEEQSAAPDGGSGGEPAGSGSDAEGSDAEGSASKADPTSGEGERSTASGDEASGPSSPGAGGASGAESEQSDAEQEAEGDEPPELLSGPHALSSRKEEARRKLERAVEEHPDDPVAWYNLGLLERREGSILHAEQAWRRALRIDPEHAPSRARLAEVDYERGRRDAAIATARELVEGQRYQAEARNLLSMAAIERENWTEAAKHARNVLLGNPNNVNAYVNLGTTFYQQDRIDQAWLVVNNGLDRRPHSAALHNLAGLIFLDKDASREATDSFLKAIDNDPQYVEAKLNLASMELSYGAFDKALQRFDEVLEQRPNDPRVHLSRGVALRGLERYEEAEAAYQQALRLDPKLLGPRYNLCVLHHQYTDKPDLDAWRAAKQHCRAYATRIDDSHRRWDEIQRRLDAIEVTMKTLAKQEKRSGADASGSSGGDAASGASDGGSSDSPEESSGDGSGGDAPDGSSDASEESGSDSEGSQGEPTAAGSS